MGDGRWKWFAPAADQDQEDVDASVDQSASDRQQQIGSETTQIRIDTNRGYRWPQR